MPQYEDHIKQAKKNLAFLGTINEHAPNHIDWQVTTCFYAACHLVNAHLAQQGIQFRNHSAVKNIISPLGNIAAMRLPEEEYACYESLFSLSRRSRYLINDKDGKVNTDEMAFTGDKHLAKSIRHLDRLIVYFSNLYTFEMPITTIRCIQLSQTNIQFFKVIK